MIFTSALVALAAIGAVQAFTLGAVLFVGRQGAAVLRWLPLLVSGAAGVLLATACLDLLPEAVKASGGSPVTWETLLVSLLALFCLETLVDGISEESGPHDDSEPSRAAAGEAADKAEAYREPPTKATGTTPLLLGSALHSVVDGVAIAAAFAAGPRAGWSAALAVALHEMPHRVGDFSLLLHKGVKQRDALRWSMLAGAAALLGGLAVTALGARAQAAHLLLPVSAASFLYIALVDLLPELQAHRHPKRMWWEVASLLFGAGLIAVAMHLAGE